MKGKKLGINLGCGFRHKESDEEIEWINVDMHPEVNPDKIVDLEKRFPFEDNKFDIIFTQHALEHVRPQYFRETLNEMARISKNNSVWEIEMPWDNTATRTNYDHYRTGGFRTFDTLLENDQRSYYTKSWRLIQLHKTPNKLVKLFFYMFPFFKKNIFYRFKLVKS